jgi:hypothetical protein
VDTAVWSEALLTSWPSSFDESPQVSSKPGALQSGNVAMITGTGRPGSSGVYGGEAGGGFLLR